MRIEGKLGINTDPVSLTTPGAVIPFAKTILVNAIAAFATFAFCWTVFAVFDQDTGRAGILAACVSVGVVAYGAYAWPADRDYLDTFLLAGCFVAALGITIAIVAVDFLLRVEFVPTMAEAWRYARAPNGSGALFVATIIFAMLVPFLFTSLVRSCAIGIMVNVFGANKFGVASETEMQVRRQYEENRSRLVNWGELTVLLAVALLAPGIWALIWIHDGQLTKGIVVLAAWIIAFSLLCIWLHLREMVSLWVSGSATVITMLLGMIAIWK